MRVAIIGAGVSGLACANELERHGIAPDVFEDRWRCGELFPHVGVLLQIMHRPVKDLVQDLQENYDIHIKPLGKLKKITMYAPKTSGTVYGDLGHLIKLGQSEDSITGQLLGRLKKTVINYNCRADFLQLARAYDYVVVASGNQQAARVLGCWEDLNKSWVMGAVVLGSFDPAAMMMWVNTGYARNGYAYLTPFDQNSASLVLVVTDVARDEIYSYWEKFWRVEKLSYKVAELWDLEHVAGFVYPHQVDNIILAGNAGGFLESFLGFGHVKALRSGVYAARSIAGGGKYEESIEQLQENIRVSSTLRKQLDRLKNEDYDHLVAFLTTPGIKQLFYNTNLDMFKLMGKMLDMIKK